MTTAGISLASSSSSSSSGSSSNSDDLNPLNFYHTLRSCQDTYLSTQLNQALDTLSDALRLYGPENVFSSYNGGKDADVIMHLLRAVCGKYAFDHQCDCLPRLVYFAIEDEFDEVIQHIDKNEQRYGLQLTRYNCGIVQGLQQHIVQRQSTDHPAFVLGTRKGDPNCGNHEIFAPSSTWMPVPFMRVNPIMNWEYGHVWHFLRLFNLPYCSLYDQGYTSLGKKSLTLPNPHLLRKDPSSTASFAATSSAASEKSGPRTSSPDIAAAASPGSMGSLKYWPAYMLSDWSLERAGRVNKEEDALKLEASALKALEQARLAMAEGTGSANGSRSNSFSATVSPSKGLISRSDSMSMNATSTTIDNATKIRHARTAALIIIGDEILNGFTSDSNLQVTSKALASIGIPLKMVSIVSDDIEEIAIEVSRLSSKYDLVITSGGIGPTHDDVTLKAIAKALGQSIVLNTEMVAHLQEIHSMESSHQRILQGKEDSLSPVESQSEESVVVLDESMLKLAMLPHLSQLRFPPAPDNYTTVIKKDCHNQKKTLSIKAWPILQCSNIFVLPGVPQYFANKISLLVKYFLPKYPIQEKRSIVLGIEERTLVTHLDRLVTRFPQVKIGSYPFEDHLDFKTIIRIEGKNAQIVDDAVAGLLEELPSNAVLRVEKGEKYDPAV